MGAEGAPRGGHLGAGCGHKPGWGPGAERSVRAAWTNNVGPRHICVFAQKDLNDSRPALCPPQPCSPRPPPLTFPPCHLEEPLKGSIEVKGNALSLAGMLSATVNGRAAKEGWEGWAPHRTERRDTVPGLRPPSHAPEGRAGLPSEQ